jgi:urea transport system permease protein
VSLGMQQIFRTFIGPKEVSPALPEWLMGSWAPAEGLDIPINGMFVLGLTTVVTLGVLLALHRSRWGLRVRATVANRVMANATGIDTKRTDRLTFAIGCGIAGMAGAAFTTIGSTGPTSGQLYIVDAFLVVTFGGAASLLGTVVSAFGIAQTQSIAEFFITGSMAKVLTLSLIVLILMMRPQGLFAVKVRR